MNYTIADLLSVPYATRVLVGVWFCFGVFCHYQRYFVLSLRRYEPSNGKIFFSL